MMGIGLTTQANQIELRLESLIACQYSNIEIVMVGWMSFVLLAAYSQPLMLTA
jgi:hypothetical protein